MKTYPGEQQGSLTRKTARYAKTGEFRPPKRGEFFLSGAPPEVYRTPNDLSQSYHIMRPATHDETHCRTCGQPNP